MKSQQLLGETKLTHESLRKFTDSVMMEDGGMAKER